jgi:gas vesicle protein
MPETPEVITFLLGLGGLASIIAGGAVYYTRQSVNRIDNTTSTSIQDIKSLFQQNSKDTREDIKNLVVHIDERIDKIYTRLESNSTELKEYVAQEVSALKAKDYDQDIKLEHTKDKLHGLSEDLLKFKLEASEKYQKKDD